MSKLSLVGMYSEGSMHTVSFGKKDNYLDLLSTLITDVFGGILDTQTLNTYVDELLIIEDSSIPVQVIFSNELVYVTFISKDKQDVVDNIMQHAEWVKHD